MIFRRWGVLGCEGLKGGVSLWRFGVEGGVMRRGGGEVGWWGKMVLMY